MADFCKQCSEKMFGEDFGDLAKLISEKKVKEEKLFAEVLCEGCGPTLVDHNGECQQDCPCHADQPETYTIREFAGALQVGAFNDEDGGGELVDKDGNKVQFSCRNFHEGRLTRLGYTGVIWYNK